MGVVFPAQSYDLDPHYKFSGTKSPESPLKNTWSSFQTQLFTGSFGYEYKIAVPPGVNGLAPTLTLSYNSHSAKGKAGWVGAGWEIPLNYIQRDIEYTRKDTADDTFDLFLEGAKHDLVYVPAESRYHTKVEAYLKVQKLTGAPNDTGEYWLVTDRDGTQYRFGYNPDSENRVRSSDGAVPAYVWRWSLDLIQDTNGNGIYFSYAEDPTPNDRGAVYLSRIEYNNDRQRRIELILEETDKPDRYLTLEQGSETQEARRLKEIRISVGGALARKYVLDYAPNEIQTQSLLASITQYGADGVSALAPVRFTYQAMEKGFPEETPWSMPGEKYIRKVVNGGEGDGDVIGDTFDVNGDGLPDMVGYDEEDHPHWDIWFNTKSGFASSEVQWTVPNNWDIRDVELYSSTDPNSSPDTKASPMDINRDGYVDFLEANEESTLRIQLGNGGGLSSRVDWPLATTVSIQDVQRPDGVAPNVYQEFFDINGDGLPDLVKKVSDTSWHVWRNTGSGFTDYGVWPVPHFRAWLWDYVRGETPDLEVGHYDMNDDGLEDIVDSADGNWLIYLNTGSGFLPAQIWPAGSDYDLIHRPGSTGNVTYDLLDINGDSLPDIVDPKGGGTWKIRFNTGHGFTSEIDWPTSNLIPANGLTRHVEGTVDPDNAGNVRRDLLDMNGDGVVDLVRKIDEEWKVYFNHSGQADLLTRITDTLGGTVDVRYASSMNYANTRLPFNFWVVTSLTKNNGMAGPHALISTTQFAYAQGLYDFPTREFRGFGQVAVTRPDGAREIHYFHQEEGRKGKEYQVEVKSPADAPFAATQNSWAIYRPAAAGIYAPRLLQTDELTYDGAAAGPRVKRTLYQNHDEYGNVGLEMRLGDAAASGDEAFIIQEFAINPERWIVDRLAHSAVAASLGGAKQRESWFHYDGGPPGTPPIHGNLTAEDRVLSTGANAITRYGYDAYGNRVTTIDPAGRKSQTVYDSVFHTFPARLINPLGQATQRQYNPANGEIALEIDPNGFATRFSFDAFQRKTREIRPYDSTTLPTTQIQYNLDGQPPEQVIVAKRESSGQGGTLNTVQSVDGFGNLIQTRADAESAASQLVTDVFYDPLDRVIQQSNPYLGGNIAGYGAPNASAPATRYGYDTLSRPVLIANPDGTRISRLFNHWIVTETDENNHSKIYSFDGFQRLAQVMERNGGESYFTRYQYDAVGQLRQITDHLNNVTTLQFDTLGRKIAMTDPDLGQWRYTYDPVGNLIAQTDARGVTVRTSYDPLNRKLRIDYPHDPAVQFRYDQGVIGTLAEVSDASGKTSFAYDQRLRKIKETRVMDKHTWTTEWGYDALDRVVRQVYPGGQAVQFGYNNQGLLDHIPGIVNDLNYNASGRLTLKSYANGKSTTYSYQPQNQRLTAISSAGIQSLNYSYDAVGNITSIQDGITGRTERFSYDALDRLTSAGDGGYGIASQAEGDDASDQRTKTKDRGYSSQYQYNAIGNLLKATQNDSASHYSYGSNAGPHAVTRMTVAEPRLGSFVLRYGDAYTLSNNVPLNAIVMKDATRGIFGEKADSLPVNTAIAIGDTATEYLASEREDFAGASWKPYTTTPLFTLSPGYGRKTTYFKIRKDGNESQVKFDSIVYAPDKNGDGLPDHLALDTDGDGMPDEWETQQGLNPHDPTDAAGDLDRDGLTNLQEFLYGTNPASRDSDGDGWSDYEEVVIHGTNPNNPDTDGDGLSDSQDPDPLNPETPKKASANFNLWGGRFNAGGGNRKSSVYALVTDSIGQGLSKKTLLAADLLANPAQRDFGSVMVGQASQPQLFTLRNASSQNQGITSLTLAGTAFTHYTLSNNQCSKVVLPAGGQCTFAVSFKPAGVGVKPAIVQVKRADFSTLQAVLLSGVGVPLDSDRDGMPDSYESANQLDPFNPYDAQQDADHDGYTNLREYQAGSNPNDSNSTPQTLQIVVSATSIKVPEGGTARFQVKLSQQPNGTVTVMVSRISGDSDISVQSGAALSFTSQNWNTFQTVTLAAAKDQDASSGTAVIQLSAAYLTPAQITATEQDISAVYPGSGVFDAGGGYRVSSLFAVRDSLGNSFRGSLRLTASAAASADELGNNALDADGDGVPDNVDSRPNDAAYRGSESHVTVLDHDWKQVALPSRFVNPVVILGPPTFHDGEPGVARIRNVTTAGFEARFQEWAYLDGHHPPEEIPHLVMETGRQAMPDGSVWEVGTFNLDGTGQWRSLNFSQPFTDAPLLFLTVQTDNDSQPVVVRARGVTTNGFDAALFEEATLADGHGNETVGYLAISSSAISGTVNIGGKPQPYLLQSTVANERWTPVLSSDLKLEREQSKSGKGDHGDETLAVLALGSQLFAQNVSAQDNDAIALRRRAPANDAPLEWGTVNNVTQAWTTVPLAKTYDQPVVVAKVAPQTDADLGVIRIRQADASSFQVRFQEWSYLDGEHPGERIFYLVAEAGSTMLAGLKMEAGKVATCRVMPGDDPQTVNFTQPFSEAPALFTTVMTTNELETVSSRVDNLDAQGFRVALQEQESNQDGHAEEVIGWIALDKGATTTRDGRRVEVHTLLANHNSSGINFVPPFERRFPILLGDLNTAWDVEPAVVAQRSLTASAAQLCVQEEQSLDAETSHATETLSVFAAE